MKMNTHRNFRLAGTFLTLAVVGLLLTSAQAAETKIAIIDLKRIFDNYWKTKQANADLEEQKADIEKKRKGMLDDYQKANEEFKKLMESASDQAVSTDERDKRKSAAERKNSEIKEIEQTIKLYQQNSEENLRLYLGRARERIIREIRDLVDAKSKGGGYTLVIDVAALSSTFTPVVLYNNGQSDLTEEVLSTLNAGAPANLLKTDDVKEKPGEKKQDKK